MTFQSKIWSHSPEFISSYYVLILIKPVLEVFFGEKYGDSHWLEQMSFLPIPKMVLSSYFIWKKIRLSNKLKLYLSREQFIKFSSL